MLLVTSNKSKQLLCVSYIGHVQAEEFQRGREDLTSQLRELSPGFHLLADFSQLDFMELDCEPELGRTMDLIRQAGVGLVVRVIPRPNQDIGMNILTVFHYPHRLRVVTCKSLAEAAKALGL
jgi:anti-anti-sigma regulatory factor